MTTGATPKIKGPASYFPSIEKTYGEPVSHWMAVLKQAGQLKHKDLVSLLKVKLGYGHANALVAHFLAQKRAIGSQLPRHAGLCPTGP